MPALDRSQFITLLERLGAADDAIALGAARDLDRAVKEAGLSWDDLLRPETEEDDEDEALTDDDEGAETDDEADADDEPEREGAVAEPPDEPVSAAVLAEDAKLVERLLARKRLSKSLREELVDLKSSIDDGSFDAMDSHYLRALAKRLDL